MERTISAMIGKGSVNHNTRAFTAKNVDKSRSVDNVEFCQEDIKQVYHKLFDCQTAHCGRCKPHFIFCELTFPIVPYRDLPQTLRGLTADCRSLV